MEWPLLASLGEDERQAFLSLGRRRRFGRNDIVCHAGDPGDSLHLVVSGRLAVMLSLPSGEAAMVNVLVPGGYFGELALLRDDSHRTATIYALEDAETLAVSAAAFHRLRETRPGVERTLTVLLGNRIDELSRRLIESHYVGVDRRLYRRLHELCAAYAAGEVPVTIPLTQSQLADLVGGTRPTVNQALQRLADDGVLSVARGRVVVLDVVRLRARCAL